MCGVEGGNNFHLICFKLIPFTSHPRILNWRKSKVKETPACRLLHSLLFFLCCFTPPLWYPGLAPWTLSALWPLCDYFAGRHFAITFLASSWNPTTIFWLTVKWLFDLFIYPRMVLLAIRSCSFTTWEQTAKFEEWPKLLMSGSLEQMT